MKRSIFRSDNLRGGYAKSLLLWTPLVVLSITFFLGGLENFWSRIAVSMSISYVVLHVCFAAVVIARFVVSRYSTLGFEHPMLRSRKWTFSISLFAMPIGLYLGFKAAGLLAVWLGVAGTSANADDYRYGIFIGTAISGLYFLFETRAEARDAVRAGELRVKALENERLQAQLSAMTAQMNPHLLFNALNSIASLVESDPARAEATIVKLSELYRGVLESSRQMSHSLAKELEICESYLSIEQVRFGERLHSRVEVSGDCRGAMIPALSLQPLVENAVKHGLSSRASGGTVVIRARREGDLVRLEVEDDGIGIAAASGRSKSTGAGLSTCRERVELQFGGRGRFEVRDRDGGGTLIAFTLPFTTESAR